MAIQETTIEPLAEEQAALARQWNKLQKQYADEFIALLKGKVVGHGPDDEVLAAEMYAQFGDAPFYIAFISKEPLVYSLPSPELA